MLLRSILAPHAEASCFFFLTFISSCLLVTMELTVEHLRVWSFAEWLIKITLLLHFVGRNEFQYYFVQQFTRFDNWENFFREYISFRYYTKIFCFVEQVDYLSWILYVWIWFYNTFFFKFIFYFPLFQYAKYIKHSKIGSRVNVFSNKTFEQLNKLIECCYFVAACVSPSGIFWLTPATHSKVK